MEGLKMIGCQSYMCQIAYFFTVVIIIAFYLMLPVPLLILLSSWLGGSRVGKTTTFLITGILMGLYAGLSCSFAINYFSRNDVILISHREYSHLLQIASPIIGAISGIFLLFGIRLKTSIEKIFFIFGLIAVLILAFFAGFLILVPVVILGT